MYKWLTSIDFKIRKHDKGIDLFSDDSEQTKFSRDFRKSACSTTEKKATDRELSPETTLEYLCLKGRILHIKDFIYQKFKRRSEW